MRLYALVFFIALSFASTRAQQITWLSFEEVQKKMRVDPKPVVIFIHTDWCRYCAMQESNTFTDPLVTKKLTLDYYAIRLNAEEKSDITFLNRKYRYRTAGTGYHELAELLGKENGQLTFPTTLILSESFTMIDRSIGFISSESFLKKIHTSPSH